MSNYINGRELFEEMCVYHEAYKITQAAGLERPPITDKIANAIMQIANRMSASHNFANYSFRGDMVSDAILKCFQKIHLFDPLKSENTFAYISQISHNAFINRIKIEQNQTSVKAKLIREKMSDEFVQHGVDSDNDENSNGFIDFLREHDCYNDYHAERVERIKKEIHPSLRHKNKTPYVTKPKEVVDNSVFDLSEFLN